MKQLKYQFYAKIKTVYRFNRKLIIFNYCSSIHTMRIRIIYNKIYVTLNKELNNIFQEGLFFINIFFIENNFDNLPCTSE